MPRELYRDLGYSTMRAYAMEDLGFSSTRDGDFRRLAEKLEQLPILKEELLVMNCTLEQVHLIYHYMHQVVEQHNH